MTMRQVEWIERGGMLGQQGIRLAPNTTYIATLLMPPQAGECRERLIKDAITRSGFHREKLSRGERGLPGWLQNRPLEAGVFSQKRADIQRTYPGWCIWYARIRTSGPGSGSVGPFQVDSRGGLIARDEVRIWAIYQDWNDQRVYEATPSRPLQPGPDIAPEPPVPSQPPPGYIDIGQSGIVAEFSPIPWLQSPPPGSQPPPTPPPTGAPQPPMQGKQLYIIDPATGQATAAGSPQPMTHTQVRANIEAAARQPGAPLMGYGKAGTGVPNHGIYDTTVTPPVWDKVMVQAWYFDDAAKTWTPWGQPAPFVPRDLQTLLEAVVNQGNAVGTGWSAPGDSQPLLAYREGQWQVPGLAQLWVRQGEQWVKVGFPVIRTLTGIQKDVEAAVAAGSPPLGVSGDGATEPTFVYDGQWRQLSPQVQETAPPPGYPSIPGVPAGTPSLPPGLPPTIIGVPFPTPAMPGVPAGIVASAIDSIQKAAAACPGLAAPNSALQHALSVFGVFAALSVAQGLSPDGNLDVLHAELDKLCPQWRGTQPGAPPPPAPPAPPPAQADVAELLGQVALALAGAATTALPGLFAKANEVGLPGLAEQIRQYAEQSGTPIPGAEPPPPKEPPPSTPATPPDEKVPTTTEKKKEKKTNVALIGLGVITAGLAAWALS